MTAPTIETVNGQDFGRCGCCGGRMDPQRARDGKTCFICERSARLPGTIDPNAAPKGRWG